VSTPGRISTPKSSKPRQGRQTQPFQSRGHEIDEARLALPALRDWGIWGGHPFLGLTPQAVQRTPLQGGFPLRSG
jgi:hypothetical protein